MRSCFVPGCNHRNDRFQCTFHVFPKEKNLRNLWIKNIKRKDAPGIYSRVCSCHFTEIVRGKSVPTLFPWTEMMAKKTNISSAEKLRLRRLDKIRIEAAAKKGLEETIHMCLKDISKDHNYVCPNPTEGSKMCSVATQSEIICADKETQTIRSVQHEAEMTLLQSEMEGLKKEITRLKQQRFGWHCIEHDDSIVQHYTGIDTESFYTIRSLCEGVQFKYVSFKPTLSFTDQLLLTMMKLRLGLSHIDLSVRFCISTSSVGNIFRTLLLLLHRVLFKALMTDEPEQKNCQLSISFQEFRQCHVVFDCAEFPAEIPKRIDEQNTIKVLVGVASNGIVTFCSDSYPALTSDREIVEHCGVLNVVKSGDLILAGEDFTSLRAEEKRNVAKARKHVENAIKGIKVFRILNSIPVIWYSQASEIIQLCAAVNNFRNPSIKSKTDQCDIVANTNSKVYDGDNVS